MAIVVDPSALLGLALDDEPAVFASAVLDEVQRAGAIAPWLFWYELRNVLIVNERRKRISRQAANAFLATSSDLPIELVSPGETSVLDLARTHDLSAYDASYLELSLRFSAPLATLDRSLRSAAAAARAPVFESPH